LYLVAADGGIEVASGVIGKRVSTDVRVHVAGRVIKSATAPIAVLSSPIAFCERAEIPAAVFELPVVFSVSAPAPVAVFELPFVLL
jgi:hypothetical protein